MIKLRPGEIHGSSGKAWLEVPDPRLVADANAALTLAVAFTIGLTQVFSR
jgi:hypothetical protein